MNTLSEKYLHALIENILDLILIIKKDGTIKNASPSVNKLLGYDYKSIVGKNIIDFIHPEDRDLIIKGFEECLINPEINPEINQQMSLRMIHNNGTFRHIVSNRKNLLHNPEINGIVITAHDITDLTKINRQVKQTKDLLDAVESISKVGGWEYDLLTNKMYWTQETYNIHDIEPEDFPNGTRQNFEICLSRFSEKDKEKFLEAFNQCTENGKQFDIECRFTTIRGRKLWIRTVGKPIQKLGKINKIVGNFVDITRQKRFELLLNSRIELVEYSYQCTLDEFIQKLLDEVEKLTESEIGFYHFVDDDQENLKLQSWSTNTIKKMCNTDSKGAHYSISNAGVWVDCFHARKPVIHNDYESLAHKKGMPEGHAKLVREMVIPIIRNEKIVSILGVGNKGTDYDSEDLKIANQLADLSWDIVQRIKSENELIDNKNHLEAIFENSPIAIWEADFTEVKKYFIEIKERGVKDLNGFLEENYNEISKISSLIKIDAVNRSSLKMVGASSKEEVYENLLNIFIEDSIEIVKAMLINIWEGKLIFENEIPIKKLNGENAIFLFKLIIVPSSDKRGERVLISFIDITETKKTEKELRHSEIQFRQLVEKSSDIFYRQNFNNGMIVYISPKVKTILGYSQNEMLSMSFKEQTQLIHPDDLDDLFALKEKLVESEDSNNTSVFLQYRIITKNGMYKWMHGNYSLLRNKNNEPKFIIAGLKDITETKIIHEQLKSKNQFIEDVLNSIPESTSVIDAEGNILLVNSNWEKTANQKSYNNHLLPIAAGNYLNVLKNLNGQYSDNAASAYNGIKEVLNGSKDIFELEYSLNFESDTKWFLMRVVPFSVGEYGAVISHIEITTRKLTEVRINEANDFANRKNKELEQKNYELRNARKATLNIIEDLSLEIEERKKTEAALRESEKKFNKLFELNPVMMALSSYPERKIVEVNSAMLKTLGYERNELVGKKVSELTLFRGVENQMAAEKELVTKGLNTNVELELNTKDGRIITGLFSAEVIESQSEKYFLVIIIDITETNRLLQRIRKLSSAVEQSPVSIKITDIHGVIEYVNPSFCQITGYTAEEAIGKNPNLLNAGKQEHEFYKNLWGTINNGKNWAGVFNNRKKNGDLFWESAIISPIKDEKGTITHYLAVKEDITDKVAKENELKKYRDHLEELVDTRTAELDKLNHDLVEQLQKEKELELLLRESLSREKELNELKTQFISTASHEFKTPLTSVMSSAELIQKYGKKWSETKINEHFGRIRKSVDYINRLLEEVLTISRVDTGKIKYQPEKANLYELCNEIITEIKSAYTEYENFIFNYKLEETQFNFDPKLLKFILSNLLSNAFKYSDCEGKIEMNVAVSKNKLVFTIVDEGIGIPESDRQNLFEPFYRCSNSGDVPGTGLGLSIVKQSVEMHRGNINVQSKLGEGTKFTVKLDIINNN